MKVLQELNDPDDNLAAYMFWCPGCKTHHSFALGRWEFNGNFQKPTFSPSLLITMPSDPSYRCHLFVRDGKIEFCSDSNHEFSGKTIDMQSVDIDERYVNLEIL